MSPKKKQSFEDVTFELNYTQAIKDQISFDKKYDCNWDEERVRRAAHFLSKLTVSLLKLYLMKKHISPRSISSLGICVKTIKQNARSSDLCNFDEVLD